MVGFTKSKFSGYEEKIFLQVKRFLGLSYLVLVNFQKNLIGCMRPIFMVLYRQACDFCDQISLYIQMYKQYFQMFCGAVQEVCLKISFYLPCFIIGAVHMKERNTLSILGFCHLQKPAYLIFPSRSLHSFLNLAISIFLWPESCRTVLDLGLSKHSDF